ncbi:MAG: DUF3330 domain-containing protein, partial [Gammaproteobacteria bacterium]
MPESTASNHTEYLSCEVCLTSIPNSEVKCIETEEYVAYFYGLECYDVWSKQQKPKVES